LVLYKRKDVKTVSDYLVSSYGFFVYLESEFKNTPELFEQARLRDSMRMVTAVSVMALACFTLSIVWSVVEMLVEAMAG
jgi:hypothetical protein